MSRSLNELEDLVVTWGKDRGILPAPSPYFQALKTVSEVGEFADNVAKGRCVKDDIGDILVTLIMNSRIHGTNLTECLELAYDTISKRRGKMVDGVFVKEEDYQNYE